MTSEMAKRSELHAMLVRLAAGEITPLRVVEQALARANSNAGKNVFIGLDVDKALQEAEQLPERFRGIAKPPLYGLPVSLKDLFDLQGFPTSCGSRFYAERGGVVLEDSAVAARLRTQGAVIVGKTHLHQLAYGITGGNPDYGDCVQPGAPQWLTGGSSSGAAASVMEGSALAAIGTDTGGSIRAPAALCGLAGYRASIGLAHERGLWRGSVPLAGSFDTLGWLFRDLRDGPLLANALFDLQPPKFADTHMRIGCAAEQFVGDCEPNARDGFAGWQKCLRQRGAEMVAIDTGFWEEAMDIYVPIQAHEAAMFHGPRTGNDFSHFHPVIAERLTWGLSLSEKKLAESRARLAVFCSRMDDLFRQCDFFLAPCAPVSRLTAGADHSASRRLILRYTTPMSLPGMPVVTLPAPGGAGVQLIARRGDDARVLAFAAEFGGADRPLKTGVN
jgi:Asp-tRNA(Asn)/Glu-tRNA(Gln) amidotransferase A subunit family amidase